MNELLALPRWTIDKGIIFFTQQLLWQFKHAASANLSWAYGVAFYRYWWGQHAKLTSTNDNAPPYS